MTIYTIGFTKKSAETFFNLIKDNQVKKLIDVRLNNISQLAGFAKKEDLRYFLKELCQCDYEHVPDLAPTPEIFKPYRAGELNWERYADKFMALMAQRNIEKHIHLADLNQQCLLCSEHLPHHCHRRLVLDYLSQHQQEEFNRVDLY